MTGVGASGPPSDSAPGPAGTAAPVIERLVVAGPPAILAPLVESLDRDPAATVIDAGSRDPAGPERIVIALPADRAAALTRALGTVLAIEPDLPLHPLDGTGPRPPSPQSPD